MICDAHCHFFSSGFLRGIGREAAIEGDPAEVLPPRLGWDPPGTDDELADRWVTELESNGVRRAMLIASAPGDEAAVAAAVRRFPGRVVGAFMFNPTAPNLDARLERAFGELELRTVCLFPAMHHVRIDSEPVARVFELAERYQRVVFVHCGVLTVGARTKLGLANRFDLRLGDPLAVGAMAVRHPSVPVIIPHFGAGYFREALIAADQASNIYLDTSSSNSWTRFHPGLTLPDVFARALDVVGPRRLLFGTDSSYFPRGWQRAVYEQQREILTRRGMSKEDREMVFGGNFLACL